jgi:alpha/beta hydrolase fold
MTGFPDAAAWRRACGADPVLGTWAGPWTVCFAVRSGHDTVFNFRGRTGRRNPGTPAFILAAPEPTWARFLEPVPPRQHHSIFAMMYRLPEFSIQGDELAFMQHAHVARRVLEVGKWLALGGALPVPVSLHPREGARAVPDVSGRYVPVAVGGATYQIYSESAGSGQDVLCMHTAGADGRQFHGLMADPRIVRHHRLVSFDPPWHGKSPPPEGAIQGSWRLNTDLYVALIMGFVGAARLEKPVALGASMSGEICLELAYRHPEAFAGIIPCEACD